MLLVSMDALKKIVWIVVCVAWILLLIRIFMIIFKIG
jgi:hypothetical protein